MITYDDYRHLAFKFGEERALRLFPRTIAALRREMEHHKDTKRQ